VTEPIRWEILGAGGVAATVCADITIADSGDES
jgi:fumarate reductase subunit D